MDSVILKSISYFRLRLDDDWADRLSRLYTVVALVAFGLLVGAWQLLGRPINCWCPAEFADSHRDYADAICWASNTYVLPMEETIPGENFSYQRNKAMISYYHWLTLILIFQGLLAFLPCLIWRFLNRRSGVNMTTVMDSARACSDASDRKTREQKMQLIVHQIHRYLLPQPQGQTDIWERAKQIFEKACCLIGGNYLTSRYTIVKFLYLFNAIGQLIFLEKFLSSDYHLYGLHVVERLIRGLDWGYSERFPRVTLCEYEVRHRSRLHNYILQCALTINSFNEKLFIFLWFWFVLLISITAVNFLLWIFRFLYCPGHVQYVRKQIRVIDAKSLEAGGTLAKFTKSYLRRDGLFVVRLIGMNVGEDVAGEVLCGLWNKYRHDRPTEKQEKGYKEMGEKSDEENCF